MALSSSSRWILVEEFLLPKKLVQMHRVYFRYNGAEKIHLNKRRPDTDNVICPDPGIDIQSICADYFMEALLHRNNDIAINKSQKVLVNLLKSAKFLGVKDSYSCC